MTHPHPERQSLQRSQGGKIRGFGRKIHLILGAEDVTEPHSRHCSVCVQCLQSHPQYLCQRLSRVFSCGAVYITGNKIGYRGVCFGGPYAPNSRSNPCPACLRCGPFHAPVAHEAGIIQTEKRVRRKHTRCRKFRICGADACHPQTLQNRRQAQTRRRPGRFASAPDRRCGMQPHTSSKGIALPASANRPAPARIARTFQSLPYADL